MSLTITTMHENHQFVNAIHWIHECPKCRHDVKVIVMVDDVNNCQQQLAKIEAEGEGRCRYQPKRSRRLKLV